jgi:predicted glycosyltransferase
MKYVVTIQHPGHVHFFRHAIRELEDAGHEVHVFCKDLEVVCDLLEEYGLAYEALAGDRGSLLNLAVTQLTYEARLLRRARAIDPDVMTAIGGTAVAHVAPLVGARSVVFTDTEHAPGNRVTFPFADEVWTPECYHGDVPDEHHTYPGYHELAYLHPDRFEPDPAVVAAAGLDPDDRFVVLRLTAWDASHDVGQGGFEDMADAVERLEATGAEVLVTSEVDLPPDLEDRRASVAPHRMHHLLAAADLFVGEGATMAVESAVLGTPAVYVNTLRMGYTDEVEARYGLLYNCQGSFRHQRALSTAERILAGEEGGDWADRREALLADTVDTTEVVLAALRDETPPTGAGTDSPATVAPADD